MVQPPKQNDLGQRPPIYFSLRKSASCQTRSISELVDGLSPPNRWTFGMQKPVDRTIPSLAHGRTTRRLVSMALDRHSSPQRPNERYLRNVPQQSSSWLSPPSL